MRFATKIILFGFVVFVMLQATVVFSQQESFVAGKLLDLKTKEPIPFATIRIKNKSKGVISNFDGGFKIPIEFQKIGDTLEISSLGYLWMPLISSI